MLRSLVMREAERARIARRRVVVVPITAQPAAPRVEQPIREPEWLRRSREQREAGVLTTWARVGDTALDTTL